MGFNREKQNKLLAKLIAIAVLVAMCLSLAACGGSDGGEATTTGTTGVPTTNGTKQEVQLLGSGYSMSNDGDYLYWAVEYQNPEGNSTAYEFPKILVTAYDESGAVLATEDQIMHMIQPGEKQAFGTLMDCHGQTPAKVDFTMESGTAVPPSDTAIKSSDLEVSGVNERIGEYSEVSYTGTIKNNSTTNADSVGVAVILKQGDQIVYGETTYVDNLSAGQQKAFELTTYGVPSHDSYEVIAYNWI